MEASDTKSLPENAYKPLAPGEVYAPSVPAGARLPDPGRQRAAETRAAPCLS